MYLHLEHLEVIYDLGQLHHYQIMLFLLRGQGYYFCARVFLLKQIHFATVFLSLAFSVLMNSFIFPFKCHQTPRPLKVCPISP